MSSVTRARWCTPRQYVGSGALMVTGYGPRRGGRPLPRSAPSPLAARPQHLGRRALAVDGVDRGPPVGRGPPGEGDLHHAVTVQVGHRGDLDALESLTAGPDGTGADDRRRQDVGG